MAVGGRLVAELSECLGRLDRRLGELMLKEFGVVQWEFVRRGSSVSTVEIRLLEKFGEVPSAVEGRMSLGRINSAENFD